MTLPRDDAHRGLLEPGAVKVARRVLRGPRRSNAPGLPDRDLRPGKIHRKVSGCFRTLAGAQRHANVRSYLSTTRKHDIPAITALTDLFNGHPWMPPQAA